MAFRFLRNLVGGDDVPEASGDLRGPLDLDVGDRVEYYQRSFTVTGILRLREKGEQRTQYHLRDGGGELWVLEAESDRELVLSLQRPVDPGLLPPEAGPDLLWEERRLTPVHEGSAEVRHRGEIPPGKVRRVRYREYQDEAEEVLLVVEWWAHHVEVRSGEFIHEAELSLHRRGQEDFDPRPPPRVDIQALADARRAIEEAGLPPEEAAPPPDLAEARRKLAALGDAPAAEE